MGERGFATVEDPGEDATHIGVQDERSPAEGERLDCRCGVLPDSRKGQKRWTVAGNHSPVIADDGGGGLVEALGPSWVAQPSPSPQRLGQRNVGQICRPGPAGEPGVPHRENAVDRGLLEHELAHQDAPRGA
jgi:hypothetical protein